MNPGARRARGAISTSHHLATEAGAAVLRAGGNAIDAAIAAASTLCVVYPNNVALGGDLVALVRSPDGEVRFLNATGTAPSGQSLEALRARYGSKLPLRGIDTITVPGGVRGWQALHEHGASRSWAEHFEAAIRLAGEGFANSRSVAAALVEDRESLSQDPGARAVFYPDGEPLAEGARLVQPALAESLRALAERGADEFYSGELASRWVTGLGALGSKITTQDTAAYRAHWSEPLEASYCDLRVLTGPPNTSGFMLLRALNAVTALDGGPGIADPLGAGVAGLARAFHESNLVRAAALADPAFGGASGEQLVAMPAPEGPVSAGAKASGDTVGFSVISDDGWAVSLINSVYWGFGAHILEPTTGIIFQNRGTSFSLDPSAPNAFAPGKRPRHTLMPVLVLRSDEVAWVPATMGGAAQPQIHAQLLLRSLDGATPHEATHAPRWIVNEPFAATPDGHASATAISNALATVTAEADVPASVLASLTAAGFTIDTVAPHSEQLGHSNLIQVTPEGYAAASDPRSDGSAIVVSSA